MPRAIRIQETGGPEVMLLEEVEVPAPGAGQVQVEHTAIGLNFIDVYDRTGLYPQAMPGGLGREAAGLVSAVGKGVRGFRVGDRVAYVMPLPGTYADLRNVPAARVVKIPAGVSDEACRGADAQGHDRVFPAASLLSRRTRRRGRRARGRGWRRARCSRSGAGS